MITVWKNIPTPHKWFFGAFVLLALFLIYTVIFSTGVLTDMTLQQEQWLLHRPLTQFDCVTRQWRDLGEVQVSVPLTLLLLGACLACSAIGLLLLNETKNRRQLPKPEPVNQLPMLLANRQ